jgi:alkanesulfonate monooxygenase SsuD/methylene tetrahydromethanopterin reductase-like flavin-dependent oxidoreductase (luciferase family)
MDARAIPRTGLAMREPLAWHDLVLTTELAETSGYETLFLPEISGRESFATLAALARATYRIRLATGVVPMTSRTPDVMAMGAATMAELSGGRMILGVGVGDPRPGSLERLRELVDLLRSALAGEEVSIGGETFRLALPPQRVPIWIAALGEKTMRLAGEVADGVLLNWCTSERVREARRLVNEGAASAGRDPSNVTVAVYIRACVGQESAHAIPALGAAAATYASIPHYRRQFERMGLRTEAAIAAQGRISESLVESVCLVGEAGSASARLQLYRDAGADLPVVYPVPCLDTVSSIQGTVMGLAPG